MRLKSYLGQGRKSLHIVAILATLVLAALFVVVSVQGYTAAIPYLSTLNSCGIYPVTTLSQGTVGSVISTPLTLLKTASVGTGSTLWNSSGAIAGFLTDRNVTLSLYYGMKGGSGIVAATITNTGQQAIMINNFGIDGAIRYPGFSYMVVLHGRVIAGPNDDLGTNNCQAPSPARTTAATLLPGQSLTAYMTGTWSFGSTQVSGFAAGLVYTTVSGGQYSLSTDVNWV